MLTPYGGWWRWSYLGLLDVHSVLIDEVGNDGGGDGEGSGAALSTGFFSITAANGSVYVFEAQSSKQRDYIVEGLRATVARMSYQIVSGNTDIIRELYSEDAGALTGELPSLVSPSRALKSVTNAFVDRQ